MTAQPPGDTAPVSFEDEVTRLAWELVRKYAPLPSSPADADRMFAGQQPEGPVGFAYFAAYFAALAESITAATSDKLDSAAIDRLRTRQHAKGEFPGDIGRQYNHELSLHTSMDMLHRYALWIHDPLERRYTLGRIYQIVEEQLTKRSAYLPADHPDIVAFKVKVAELFREYGGED